MWTSPSNPEETQHYVTRSDRAAALIKALPDCRQQDSGIALRYGLVPEAIEGEGSVERVVFRDAEGNAETVETTLVVKAIGYRGREVPGMPFDESSGTLPHSAGRVVDPDSGDSLIGLYCSGWIKRGATGMIGTNKVDSAETVEALLHDFEAGQLQTPTVGADELDALVRQRVEDVVDNAGWVAIDQAERAAGKAAKRSRVKLVTVEELLRASAARR